MQKDRRTERERNGIRKAGTNNITNDWESHHHDVSCLLLKHTDAHTFIQDLYCKPWAHGLSGKYMTSLLSEREKERVREEERERGAYLETEGLLFICLLISIFFHDLHNLVLLNTLSCPDPDPPTTLPPATMPPTDVFSEFSSLSFVLFASLMWL